jgi:4-oxalocrotonate tautomerase family enzyme
MPAIEVHMRSGRSASRKRAVRSITKTVLGSAPARVTVVLDEVEEANWGRGGKLLSAEHAMSEGR